jgi:starch phosphorylase
LSILDGWWLEGNIEGVTGWAIDGTSDRSRDAATLYDKLAEVVLPMFYKDRDRFLSIMRHAVALNGSFFNTQRMMQQYVLNAYFH